MFDGIHAPGKIVIKEYSFIDEAMGSWPIKR
jgi:hypothetical protein